MIMRVLLLTLIAISMLATSASAATYYVDQNAGGKGDGSSWENAWTSFAKIIWAAVHPGDTVEVSGGSYHETLYIQASGTVDSPVIVKASDEAGHNEEVVIDGQNVRGSGISVTGEKYLKVIGFKVTDHTDKDIYISGRSGSSYSAAGAASYVVLDSLEVNVTGRALFIQTSDHITVQNCNIYTPTYVPKQTDGIYSQRNRDNTYDSNTIVINNTHADGHDDGIQMFQDTSITISNNYIEQNNSKVGNAQGIYATNGHGENIWYNNVVNLTDATSNGIVYRINLDGTVGLIGNTVYCKRAYHAMLTDTTPDPVIKNNIIWNGYAAAPLTIDNWSGNPANIDHNLIYAPVASKGEVSLNGKWLWWYQWQRQGFDLHGVNADPRFADVSSNDFRVQADSPAVSAGENLGAPFNLDKDGRRRNEEAVTIGAYESAR